MARTLAVEIIHTCQLKDDPGDQMKKTDDSGQGEGLTDRHRTFKPRALLGAALLLAILGLMLPRASAAADLPGFWSYTAGPLGTARSNHTATLLPDGKVLVAGGLNLEGGVTSVNSYLNSAELYNPDKGGFKPTGAMASARVYHTATLLPNGQVLVAGGMEYVGGHYWGITGAEIYDPATGAWSPTGSLNFHRGDHSATLLKNGKVLVAGGKDSYEIMSSEVYNPDSGQWSTSDWLNRARSYHAAVLLPNGNVLVAGGKNSVTETDAAEIYHPETGSWKLTGYLNAHRAGQIAVLLPNGKILVAAGDGFSAATSEIYNPVDKTWGSVAALKTGRIEHTVTLLNNGHVLVIGGLGTGYESLASAEIYRKKTLGGVPNILTNKDLVWITRGKTAIFRVKLSRDPGTAKEVSVTKVSGGDEITVTRGANLEFNSWNWNSYQTVTLEAANNPNNLHDTTLFQLNGDGLWSKQVTAVKTSRSMR